MVVCVCVCFFFSFCFVVFGFFPNLISISYSVGFKMHLINIPFLIVLISFYKTAIPPKLKDFSVASN